MAEWLPLHRMLSAGRAAADRVGWRAGAWVCWAEFAEEARAWHQTFGAQSGRRWALAHDDALSFAAALLGAWQAGCCVWLAADRQPQTVERLRAQVDGFVGCWPAGVPVLKPVLEDSKGSIATLQPLAEDLDALRVHTSGSTGVPLLIPKRLAQLDAELRHLQATWPALPAAALVIGSVSQQHLYGLLFRVLWPLCSGRPLQAERLDYGEQIAMQLQASQMPAWLVSSPALLGRLGDAAALEVGSAGQVPLLAVFSSGGELPAAAVSRCSLLLGQTPIEVYGSSETGGIAWRQRSSAAGAAEPAWQPLPGVVWRLVPSTDRPGLQVRSRHLADPEAWVDTGDHAVAQGQGFLLRGRADRIAKIEEKRISLSALERAVCDTGLICEARALILGGRRRDLVVIAVPSDAGWSIWEARGRHCLIQPLLSALRESFEASILPRRWRFLDALPVDAQGKSTQALLQARLDPRLPEVRQIAGDARQARLRLRVEAASPWLQGHFPGLPILPGVVQVDWVLRLGRERLGVPHAFRGIRTLKFHQVIRPQSCVDLSLAHDPVRGQLAFELSSAAGLHASGKLLVGAAP